MGVVFMTVIMNSYNYSKDDINSLWYFIQIINLSSLHQISRELNIIFQTIKPIHDSFYEDNNVFDILKLPELRKTM